MNELSSTTHLVGQIYEAALDSSKWLNFLVPFCLRLKSHVGMIWANNFSSRTAEVKGAPGLSDEATENIFTYWGMDPAALASFAAYYASRNVWLEDPKMHVEGRVVHGNMLFPDNRLKKTEYWADWLRPQGIFYTAAAVVEKRNERSVNVTVCRPEIAGPYEKGELDLIAQLMPHLQAGFALHRRLYRMEALSHTSTAVLEALPYGVLLLDNRGCLLYSNMRARELTAKAGLVSFSDHTEVRCTVSADDAQLHKLVMDTTATGAWKLGGSGGALRLRGAAGTQLQLFVAPLPAWSTPFGERTAAVIFITDPAATLGGLTTALRAVYRMSPAEARLTEALAGGRTPQEYADSAQISLNTVRTQIRQAAAKAGVGGQTDLIRVVLTGPAVLRA